MQRSFSACKKFYGQGGQKGILDSRFLSGKNFWWNDSEEQKCEVNRRQAVLHSPWVSPTVYILTTHVKTPLTTSICLQPFTRFHGTLFGRYKDATSRKNGFSWGATATFSIVFNWHFSSLSNRFRVTFRRKLDLDCKLCCWIVRQRLRSELLITGTSMVLLENFIDTFHLTVTIYELLSKIDVSDTGSPRLGNSFSWKTDPGFLLASRYSCICFESFTHYSRC